MFATGVNLRQIEFVVFLREHSYEGLPYDRPPYIPELSGFQQPSPFAGKEQ